jgi:hypothetical protein
MKKGKRQKKRRDSFYDGVHNIKVKETVIKTDAAFK